MNEEFIPTLTHATERDIDLLLVEEIFASPEFVAWLFWRSGLGESIASSTVLHSKRRTRSRREIDIFVTAVDEDGGRIALLVENKLDATEQPDQAESYREELAALTDDFDRSAAVLVCPSAYSQVHREFSGKFDAVVTYEEIADHFDSRRAVRGPDEARMRFRGDLLQQAITKSRRGYTPVPSQVIGGFNARYVALLAKLAPDITPGPSMLKDANPDESVSMIFDHARSLDFLPPELRPSRFAHEFGRGSVSRANYVAVVFRGWGAALPDLCEQFERDTAAIGAKFSSKQPTKVRPNPGLVLSCETQPIDNQGDFDAQLPSIEAGIRRAMELRDWLQSNTPILQGWATAVAESKRRDEEA